jgi:hypothetical protein
MKYAWLLGALVWLIPFPVQSEPVYEAREEGSGVRVVLHDTPCELSEVSNLPRKVEWHENGKVIQGCWGQRPDIGIVLMYFGADKTVGLAPMQAFRRVTGV